MLIVCCCLACSARKRWPQRFQLVIERLPELLWVEIAQECRQNGNLNMPRIDADQLVEPLHEVFERDLAGLDLGDVVVKNRFNVFYMASL